MGGMRMFNVGDRVVYPMHGAGTIEGVEEKEILGKTHRYYVLRLPIGDMKVMIPVDNTEGIGLRDVISPSDVDKVMGVLREECTAMSTNWNRRYRHNLEKIKTGDIYEVAGVVRNLASREREKGLSTGERKMLDSAKEILISELILARDWDREEALNVLETTLCDDA
jgi:CarD family transcriptional regulator